MNMNENDHYRGLHIIVMSPTTGEVDFAAVFDTYKSSEDFDMFIRDTNIEKGSLVVAACKDDCISALSV